MPYSSMGKMKLLFIDNDYIDVPFKVGLTVHVYVFFTTAFLGHNTLTQGTVKRLCRDT
jgi:hypothetical protein